MRSLVTVVVLAASGPTDAADHPDAVANGAPYAHRGRAYAAILVFESDSMF